jgi:hypothetical protein
MPSSLPGGCRVWWRAFIARIALPGICLPLMVCAVRAQSTCNAVFCSGFEEGSKAVWDDYDGNPDSTNLIVADPGPLDAPGNHVMRLRVPPGRGGADLVKVLPGKYDRLYARWYQKWERGYNFAAPCHGGGLHAGNRDLLGRSDYRPQGNDWFGTWIEPYQGRPQLYSYYRGMYQDCVDPNGSCWGDVFPCTADEGSNYCEKAEHRDQPGKAPPQLETGRWYCIEIMLDAGSAANAESMANGRQDFWIDGKEYGPFEHLWHRTTADVKISILWLSLFHHDATHSTEGIMLDDVVVAENRIGPSSAALRPTARQISPAGRIGMKGRRLVFPEKFVQAQDIAVEIYTVSGQRIVRLEHRSGRVAPSLPLNLKPAGSGILYCRIRSGSIEETHALCIDVTEK